MSSDLNDVYRSDGDSGVISIVKNRCSKVLLICGSIDSEPNPDHARSLLRAAATNVRSLERAIVGFVGVERDGALARGCAALLCREAYAARLEVEKREG